MNIDGSNLHALTDDRRPKRNLQWFAETDRLIYLVAEQVEILDTNSGDVDVLFAPDDRKLSDFRISPDGLHVAVSFGNEIFVGKFSEERYRQLKSSTDLFSEETCLISEENTPTASLIKEFRWSNNGQKMVWLENVPDNSMPNQIRQVMKLYDITTCAPASLSLLDEFPRTGMNLDAYSRNPIIPAFDWDGDSQFVFNTEVTSLGWGDLYIYNTDFRTSSTLNPVGGHCCYRDARWSPDGLYLFFAFQDNDTKAQVTTQFYYIAMSNIGTGQEFTPIPLPVDFFIVSGEAPQPALHRATK